jgi:predicted DNA-binding transcriptional regulator AlpA
MAGKKQSAPEGFLTTEQAALKLGVQQGTVRRWSSEGGPICPIKFGISLLWKVEEVDALLSARKLPTRPKPKRQRSKRAKWSEEEVSAYMKSITIQD